jgi:hypothetical protein
MRFGPKNLSLSLLVAILACPVLMTGCKTQTTTEYNQQEPADYTQWEHETQRQHVDLEKRNADEQKEYRDWQQSHNQHH